MQAPNADISREEVDHLDTPSLRARYEAEMEFYHAQGFSKENAFQLRIVDLYTALRIRDALPGTFFDHVIAIEAQTLAYSLKVDSLLESHAELVDLCKASAAKNEKSD